MHAIRKTTAAETDIEDIWLYTFNQWNEVQADKYLDELIEGIEPLSVHPEMGKTRDNIRAGYRSLDVGKHTVYYKIDDAVIWIIRVLHEQMLPQLHL